MCKKTWHPRSCQIDLTEWPIVHDECGLVLAGYFWAEAAVSSGITNVPSVCVIATRS